MKSAFQKISSVRTLMGGIKWYLSQDCLLAAKLSMYAVEYRRFYLRDLESVIVWPSRLWLVRLLVPGGLLAALGTWLWSSVNATSGEIFVGLAIAWLALELALGPTAKSRVCTTGITVDLPLVRRMRRAPKVLAKINAAVRAARVPSEKSTSYRVAVEAPESFIATSTETNAT